MKREVNFTGNGMEDVEVRHLDRLFGRLVDEYADSVTLRVNSGLGGVGGFFMKIKEERYSSGEDAPF